MKILKNFSPDIIWKDHKTQIGLVFVLFQDHLSPSILHEHKGLILMSRNSKCSVYFQILLNFGLVRVRFGIFATVFVE